VQCYLNNKVGIIRNKAGYDIGAGEWLHFDIRKKHGENFLYVTINTMKATLDEAYFNYIEAMQLNLAIGKCMQFLRPSEEWELVPL